jgi:putative ABC transport system substrate-binding protein
VHYPGGSFTAVTAFLRRAEIAAFALQHRLALVGGGRAAAQAGYLLGWGADIPELFRRAAGYVDKILRGVAPGDLPVEQPTKFELLVNRRTARELGLTLPSELLLRADEVIG